MLTWAATAETSYQNHQNQGLQNQRSALAQQVRGIDGYEAQRAALSPNPPQTEQPAVTPEQRRIQAAARLQMLAESYLDWVTNNCLVPSDETFIYMRDRLGMDEFYGTDLHSKGNLPAYVQMAQMITESCRWMPVAAKVMGWSVVAMGAVAAFTPGGAMAAGATAVDAALGSKFLLDAARLLYFQFKPSAEYERFGEWMRFQLSIKRTLMTEWASQSGLAVTADEKDAIRSIFKADA